MDTLDKIIIRELSNNCRMSFSTLAKKCDVSVNTIKNRVESLLKAGIIVRFDVSLKMSLLNISFALIMIELNDNVSDKTMNELGSSQFIMAIMRGFEPQWFAIAVYRNSDELQQAVEHLRSNKAVDGTEIYQLLPPPSSNETIRPSKTLKDLKQIDWLILHHLRWNGRMHLKELAERTGRSVPTVRKRLKFMRKNDLIYETLLANIGAVSEGMIINFVVELPDLLSSQQIDIDKKIASSYPENYWVSWMFADRPMMLLNFLATSATQAGEIRKDLENLIPGLHVTRQIVSGNWTYFQDFRDSLLLKKTK